MNDSECFHMPTSSLLPPPTPVTHTPYIQKKVKKNWKHNQHHRGKQVFWGVVYALHCLSHPNGNYAGLAEPFHENLFLSLKLTVNVVCYDLRSPFRWESGHVWWSSCFLIPSMQNIFFLAKGRRNKACINPQPPSQQPLIIPNLTHFK